MSDTPRTDAAMERAAYRVEDDYGQRTEYDIGKLLEDMEALERESADAVERLWRERDELARQVRDLRAKVNEDAERYRWLRPMLHIAHKDSISALWFDATKTVLFDDGAQVDAAIDAARKPHET